MIDKLDNTVINVSGSDLNDYFYNEISSISEDIGGDIGTITDINLKEIFKQLPPIHITGAGKTARSLFDGYSSLIKIGKITNDDVNNMNSMFCECISLEDVDLSELDTSKVTNMYGMFSNCYNLKNLDLSNFDTSNVTYMSRMFDECTSLTNLNISNFDFTNVTSYDDMFNEVPTDCYILVKDATAKEWITSKFPDLTNVHYVGEE